MNRQRLGLVISICAAFSNFASAQNYNWIGTASGNWDVAANWSGGPNPYPNAIGDVANFYANSSAAITVTLPGPETIGALNFNSINGRSNSLTGGTLFNYTLTGGTLAFDNGASDAQINVGSGPFGVTVGTQAVNSNLTFTNNLLVANNGLFGSTTLQLGVAASTNTISTAGVGRIEFSGSGNTTVNLILGSSITGGLRINGPGIITLASTNAANLFTGGVTINAGVLSVSSDANLGSTSNGVTFVSGGTGALRLTAGTYNAARTLTLTGNGILDVSAAATWNGVVTGAGTFTKFNVGNLTLAGNTSGFTGAVVIGGPTQLVGSNLVARDVATGSSTDILTLSGASTTLANASSITVNPTAMLVIDNNTNVVTGRLGASGLTFHGGRFEYTGNATTAIADNMTSVNWTMDGLVAISNGRTTAGAAGGTQVDFGTLTRTNGGVLWLRAPTGTSNGQIGGAPGALTINYRFSNLSPLSGLGTTSAEILPWAAQVTSSRTGTDPTRPVTYDVNGLRPLADSEFTSVTSAASWGAGLTGQNINLQATVTNAGNLTINSLFNTGTTSPTLNGSGTVTITSGYLSNFLTFTINGPNLAFGSNPAYFHLGFPVNFTGAGGILGSGGVVVSSISNSTSYLVSFGATTVNDFTGGLTINGQARVRFNNDGQLGNLATTGDNAGGIYLNGGILEFNGAAPGSINSGRTITLGAAHGQLSTNTTNAFTVNSLITGNGQLLIQSAVANGVIVLANGANNYTGGTVMGASTSFSLGYGANGALGAGDLIYTNTASTFRNDVSGGTLANNVAIGTTSNFLLNTNGNDLTASGVIRGAGGINKSGAGTLTLTGSNTFAGDLLVNGGQVRLSGASGAIANRGVSLASGATFTLDNSSANNNNRVVGALSLSAASAATFQVIGNASLATDESLGSLVVAGGTSGSPHIVSLTSNGAPVILRFSNYLFTPGGNVLFSGTDLGQLDSVTTGAITRIFFDVAPVSVDGALISGAQFSGFGGTGQAAYSFTRGVIKFDPPTASGTLIDNFGTDAAPPTGPAVSAAATYTTTGAATAKLGAAISGLVLDGGGLVLRSGVYGPAAQNANSANDTFTLLAGATVISQNGAKTIGLDTGTLAAKIDVTNNGATFNTVSNLDIAAGVEIKGSGLIQKTGAGVLTLNGAHTFTGGMAVSAGTVTLNSGTTFANGNAINVSSGATFNNGGNANTYGTITANGVFNLGGGTATAGALAGNGQINLGAGTLNVTGASTVGAIISGVGGSVQFNPAASATLTFNGANTFTGGVTGNGNALFALGNLSGLGSGNLVLNTTGTSSTVLTFNTGSGTFANNVQLSSTGGLISWFSNGANNNQTITVTGLISGGSAAPNTLFRFSGPANDSSTFVLANSSNSFTGTISIWEGVLAVTSNSALGDALNSIQLNTTSTVLGGLRFDADFTGANVLARDLNFIDSTNALNTNGFNAEVSGVLSNTGAMIKTGAGTLTLSNSGNTHTGAVTVSAGRMNVNGSLALSTSAVTVLSGAVLGGTGLINRPVTINAGGTLSPGASIGTLTVSNNVTLNGGGMTGGWDIELNAVSANTLATAAGSGNVDQLVLTGATSILNIVASPATPLRIDITALTTNFDYEQPVFYTIATAFGTNIQFNGAPFVFDPNSFFFYATNFAGGTNYTLQTSFNRLVLSFSPINPVPEPSTWGMIGLVAGGAWGWRRRRRTA